MPLKPPSRAIMRIMRMIVPSDMWHLLQPGGQLLLCLQPKKRTATYKVPVLQPKKIAALFLSNDVELHESRSAGGSKECPHRACLRFRIASAAKRRPAASRRD